MIWIWLLFGFVGMWLGPKKGHSPLIGFIAGVLLGPFVLLLGLTSPTAKKCPDCASMIVPEARVCPKCRCEQAV